MCFCFILCPLTAADDRYPFGFGAGNDQLVGFDIDLAHEFAQRRLDDGTAVELVPVSATDRIPRLIAGDVDLLLAAIPRRSEREALIDFSDPYYADYGIGLPQGDSHLRALVNFTLQDIMAGNGREWVADWYQWDYYQSAPVANPLGPASGVTKVLRGGSWNDLAPDIRSTTRKNFLPASVDANLGFRCASSTFPPSR